MSNFELKKAKKPDFDASFEIWSYDDLKRHFYAMVENSSDPKSATKSFLSNVEGLGDYFDMHALFDFQAYLILNHYWFTKHNKVLNYITFEYRFFSGNMSLLLAGKLDGWASDEDIASMKADAEKLVKLYYLED